MQDSISVIIPSWNRALYVKRAIKSALDQSFSPLEILVCDDGSTDNTFKIVKSFKDKRIKWIKGNHSGLPSVPRNRGIRQSQGNWLAFLDSDDTWLPEKLALQIKIAKETKNKAIITNAFSSSKKLFWRRKLVKKKLKNISFENLLVSNKIICSSVLIHSSLIKTTIGFPENRKLKAIEDYAFWLRIATQTNFAYIHKPLVIYNDNTDNSVRSEGYLWQQQIQVFNNFNNWANNQTRINSYYIKTVKENLASLIK